MPDRERGNVLVVEDAAPMRTLLREALEDAGHSVRSVGSAEAAFAALAQQPADVVVSDLRLPGADGMALLRWTRDLPTPPAFLVVSGFGTVDRAVLALKAGADDFLTKPVDLESLRFRIGRLLENRRLRDEVRLYRQALDGDDYQGMIGRSPAVRTIFAEIERIARGRGPVLILGESGVGKELVARAIHAESDRASAPFLAVNCAGVPASLLESEFFGHVKGAFTGATGERRGLFQQADGGTLLLDEIGEMPAELQPKLLRVLQEGTVRPVGSDRDRSVDVRILAATNQDLSTAMEEGRFRQDLFYRLETFRLTIPPLRDREGDLDLLAVRFIRRHAVRLRRRPPEPSAAFVACLREYAFPGNVRELENVVERAVTFCDGDVLEPRHLPARVQAGAEPEPRRAGTTRTEPAAAEPSGGSIKVGEALLSLREIETQYVRHVLERVGGNKRRAAALLGISRRTLYRRLDGEAGDDD
jgi:two-component system response regulator AtoC